MCLDCGNVIYHDHSGTVKSPGYPGDYPPNVDCIWQIIVDPAYHVEVTFDEDFYTELDDQCLYDFVAVSILVLRGSSVLYWPEM